ncbi:sexual differentiation process isp4 [Fusarium subglutinans]|uniref:Sexual differentiation process isp4 n=1 Tax=Gibberella subglutinans TaxID=42677 RepID=A0A8H5V1X9_GIBSU|nr:sexual differentiation process isp4 [Fusarium subglutinans]KAF5605344.1 sexual differentiation process isp4 [Fusarium subglutinans]
MPKNKKLGSVLPAEAVGQSMGGPSGRLSTSLEIEDSSNENLKHRLHEWAGERNDDEAGSEYEMLMDPNLPQEYETRRKGSGESGDEAALLSDDAEDEEEENSPYPEVRAAVRNFDEDLPCNTVRAWTIGMIFVVTGAAVNTLFSLRQPSISIGPLVAQIVAWPIGNAWALLVTDREFNTFGITWTLNPGPFNVKEHSIIVVMASVSFSVAYATDIILAQVIFYKQDFGLVFQLLLTISTQSASCPYVTVVLQLTLEVYPASMIWPENLVGVTLMNAMYETNDTPDPAIIGGRMHRYKWFAIVTACSFVYYFIPGFLAQFLSIFAVATWMAPQNPIVNQLFGGQTGVSLLPITFDWTQIAGYVGSPLIPPWHAIANTVIGVVVFFVIGSSFLHYGGAWYAEYLPMSDSSVYDNKGNPYNTSRILTKNFELDEEEYKNYSPLFLSTTFAMSYGLSFAAISSLIVYTYLHNGKQIWQQWRNSTNEKPDIHMKLMRKYKEAPTWWYMSLFAIMLLIGFYTVLGYPTNLSWWAFLLAIAISFGFALPIGIIQAVTNTQIGLNVLTEFVYGYLQPGRPLALMMAQSLRFVSDLKFGHYMKIPPRTMFLSQVVATTFSCFIQIVVLNLSLKRIPQVCTHEQVDHFTCPGGRVFFAASVIWGLLGPARMFSPGQVYSGLFVFFIVGAITPIVIYVSAKRWPRSPVRYLMAPLIFGGAGAIPPATPLNYLSWGIVGFVFQFWIKKRHFRWWTRLNFLTSSALDLGLALATLFIFFAFTLHGVDPPSWWGNNIVTSTMDVQGTAIQAHVPDGERFGPENW